MEKYKIELEVYKFSELSKEAQEKLIKNTSDNIHSSYELSEDLEGILYDKLSELNKQLYDDGANIIYSLNNCQGDGVSIDLESISNVKKAIINGTNNENILAILHDLDELGASMEISIKPNDLRNNYCHSKTASVELGNISIVEKNYKDNVNDVINSCYKVCDELQLIYEDICKKLEKAGYEYLEHILSEEYATEYLKQEELEGKMYYSDGSEFSEYYYENIIKL